jgi:ATP-dependent Zn protease
MVGRYGMSARIGPRRLLASDVDGFLGGKSGLGDLAPRALDAYDEELEKLLHAAEAEARRRLTTNREVFDRLTDELASAETLEGPALEIFLYGVPHVPSRFTSLSGSANVNGARATRKVTT